VADHIIDCCSLINLHSGWGHLDELLELGAEWHVCEAVALEAQYVREYSANNTKQLIQLNLQPALDKKILTSLKPESDAELEDYVSFAAEIDDGEAQALAIAKHRNFVLLTDDKRATKFAQQSSIGVRVTTTPEVIHRWSKLSAHNERRLSIVIPRIVDLARFSPASDAALFLWWTGYTPAH